MTISALDRGQNVEAASRQFQDLYEPGDAMALPEGTRVRITPASLEKPKSFGERFARF